MTDFSIPSSGQHVNNKISSMIIQMGHYSYKYVKQILIPNQQPIAIYKAPPKVAEKALNDLGAKGWKLVDTMIIDGYTRTWIFIKKRD